MNAHREVYDSPIVRCLTESQHIWRLTDKHLRGVLALLVSANRAMREPSNSGTSDKLAPYFMCVRRKEIHVASEIATKKDFSKTSI